MFEIIRLSGTLRQDVPHPLYTRKNTLIEANSGSAPSAQCPQRFLAFQRKYPNAFVRKGVTGGYNCAGLVWASRRAVVPAPSDWERILSDDGYVPIDDAKAAIGDIVVYRDSEPPNEILHVGRVCRMDALLVTGESSIESKRGILMIVSKLDGTLGEVIHRKDEIGFGNIRFTSQVFTDR